MCSCGTADDNVSPHVNDNGTCNAFLGDVAGQNFLKRFKTLVGLKKD